MSEARSSERDEPAELRERVLLKLGWFARLSDEGISLWDWEEAGQLSYLCVAEPFEQHPDLLIVQMLEWLMERYEDVTLGCHVTKANPTPWYTVWLDREEQLQWGEFTLAEALAQAVDAVEEPGPHG